SGFLLLPRPVTGVRPTARRIRTAAGRWVVVPGGVAVLRAGARSYRPVRPVPPMEQVRRHMTTQVSPPDTAEPDRYLAVQASPEFVHLRRALRGFVFPMTVAFILWYALYVVLSAYARGFMSTKVVGNINVALIFGLLQFVSTFLMSWLYALF